MDDRDRQLISSLRNGVPVVSNPYEQLGKLTGLSSREVIARISGYKEKKYLTKISATFNAGPVGYKSALLAFRFPAGQIEQATKQIGEHPGITYLCRRDHPYSLWASLFLPVYESFQEHTEKLRDLSGATQLLLMPTQKRFKMEHPASGMEPEYENVPEWGELDLRVIHALQNDLPLTEQPFLTVAKHLGVSEEALLGKIDLWVRQGIMKPIGWVSRVLPERRQTSVMVAWRVPEERIVPLGRMVSEYKYVRQCVSRLIEEDFTYTLYALIRTATLGGCHQVIRNLESRIGQWPSVSLLTLEEYKRSHLVFFSEELNSWKRKHALEEFVS